jgi:hypothetical protein
LLQNASAAALVHKSFALASLFEYEKSQQARNPGDTFQSQAGQYLTDADREEHVHGVQRETVL